jgi:hypothetical protein
MTDVHLGEVVGDEEGTPTLEPIDVARQANDWWMSAPFERTRELLLASEGYEDAIDRFLEAGYTPGDWINEDVEVVVDAFPEDDTKIIGQRGRDGWVSFWREWVEPLADLYLEASNYEEIGDCVIVDMRIVARRRDSGETNDVTVVQFFKVRDCGISQYAVYQDREEAWAAALAE